MYSDTDFFCANGHPVWARMALYHGFAFAIDGKPQSNYSTRQYGDGIGCGMAFRPTRAGIASPVPRQKYGHGDFAGNGALSKSFGGANGHLPSYVAR